MRPFEAAVALACVALAVRSLLVWLRRPLDATDARDHLLLALFVVTRVSAWLLVAAWFWVSATMRDPQTGDLLQGRALLDGLRDRYTVIPALFIASLAVNLLAGWFLARRPRTGAPT